MPECMITHTDYDPTIEEFNCPKCGAKHGRKFGIADEGSVGNYGCDKLHLWDYLDCSHCGWKGHGDEWVKLMGKGEKAMEGWDILKVQKKVGPFKLEVCFSADGNYTYGIFLNNAAPMLAGGKEATASAAQLAAESTIREWLDAAREML